MNIVIIIMVLVIAVLNIILVTSWSEHGQYYDYDDHGEDDDDGHSLWTVWWERLTGQIGGGSATKIIDAKKVTSLNVTFILGLPGWARTLLRCFELSFEDCISQWNVFHISNIYFKIVSCLETIWLSPPSGLNYRTGLFKHDKITNYILKHSFNFR